MNSTYISLPYVYPLCPLNFNHAKMFVVADIFARFTLMQNEGVPVIFPIASHYTGNTAQSTSMHFQKYFFGEKSEENIRTYNLYKEQYKVPISILKEFTNPHYLMDYFNQEIIWELKNLGVSCNYENAYTTEEKKFVYFVRAIIKKYDMSNALTS